MTEIEFHTEVEPLPLAAPDDATFAIRIGSILDPVARVAGYAAVAVASAALVAELVVLFANVMLRWITHGSLAWSGEVAELCLEVIAFLGGAAAYHRGEHLSLRTLRNRLSLPMADGVDAIGDALVLAVSIICLVAAQSLLATAKYTLSPVLHISRVWLLVPLMVGLALMALFALQRLIHRKSLRALWASVAIVGVGLGVIVLLHGDPSTLQGIAGGLAVAVFIAALAVGVPIGFTIAATTCLYVYASGVSPLSAVPLTMQGSVTNFILLAVPFFILAGFVMTAGGLSEPLGAFVSALVGRFRGGLMQVIVITMYVFSGISGAKTADVAAVGSTMKPELDRQGYDRHESVAVLTSSAIMGETVPPSIALLILASLTSLSVGSLFLAGLLPAAVVGVFLMVGIYLRARRAGGPPPLPAPSWSERAVRFWRAVPALLVPIILAGGILSGIATPTEVSSVAVVYAVVVSVVVYGVRSPRILIELVATSASMAGMILFIYSAASALSWSLTAAGFVQSLAHSLLAVTHSQVFFLLGTMLLLIVAGALLEGVPALVVLAPLLVPIAPDYGVDQLHYGIVMIIAMGFGSFLPPLGLGIYVAAAIFDVEIDRVAVRMVPYLSAVLIGLLVVTFVPWFTTVVPTLIHVQ